MANSLATAELISRELSRLMPPQLKRILLQEEKLKEFLQETGASLEDVICEYRWEGYHFRLQTADEKWLNWQSANHGWERGASR